MSFGINLAAAFLLFSGRVQRTAAVVMMAGSLAGGTLGRRLAGRIKPVTLRNIVVLIGIVIAAVYFAR